MPDVAELFRGLGDHVSDDRQEPASMTERPARAHPHSPIPFDPDERQMTPEEAEEDLDARIGMGECSEAELEDYHRRMGWPSEEELEEYERSTGWHREPRW